MYLKISFLLAGLSIIIFSLLQAEPSFNGSSPGCAGSGCHSFNSNDVSAVSLGNRQIQITLSGTSSKVGGELVDASGNVVASINSTNSNPFILTAPSDAKYLVNAGYKNPSRHWDSTSVDLSVTSIGSNSEENLVNAYKLSQNYPNPFNPSTTIEFYIPKSGFVTLKIYNLLGEEVGTLVDDNLSAGDYTYSWNAGSLSSGIYIYTIQAGDPSAGSGHTFQQIRKMIYLK